MATRQGTVTRGEDGVTRANWSGITEADTGSAVKLSHVKHKTVQVTGDFTSSGAITIEGSNNGIDFSTLKDQGGTTLVITDTTLRTIYDNSDYVRPRATAGSSVSMDVAIVGK